MLFWVRNYKVFSWWCFFQEAIIKYNLYGQSFLWKSFKLFFLSGLIYPPGLLIDKRKFLPFF